MPLYEYECTACGERTEVLQRVNAPSVENCPVCGSPMRRLLSAPAFQFKGSGWYVTDYARKKAPEEGTKSKGESDSTETKSDTKDTKSSSEPSSSSAKESSTT